MPPLRVPVQLKELTGCSKGNGQCYQFEKVKASQAESCRLSNYTEGNNQIIQSVIFRLPALRNQQATAGQEAIYATFQVRSVEAAAGPLFFFKCANFLPSQDAPV